MSIASGKALWSIICGQSVLASDEVVGEELEDAAEHLREGLSFYKPWSEDDHKAWETKSKLKKQQKDFVYKVAKMLEVCSEQSWKIFQLFLQHEYRGSSSQLLASASSDREETMLMHQVFNFYLSDPLHLLSCRRHILAADSSHPYQKLFKEFITKVLDADHTLGGKLVSQLKSMKLKGTSSAKGAPSPYLPPNAYPARIAHHLSAIKHQLATLLIYHGTPGRPCPPDSVRVLLQLAQGSGIGRDFLENDSRVERSSFGLQLDAIDAFLSFLLTLVINADSDPRSHPLCTDEWIKKLNPLIFSLGSKPWHYPPLLAWAILQGRRVANDSGNAEEAAKYSRLAQRAIKGNAFQYLQSALKTTAFETDHLLLVMGSSLTYSLLCIVGVCLDLEKLELTTQADNLAKVCLAFNPPSHLFWNEEGGGASVLLPSALECFPHNPQLLLDIATSLASANEFSAGKVVELIKDLECFTWPLVGISPSTVSISGNQCISRESLEFLPGFVISKGSHAVVLDGSPLAPPLIVCWQVSTNGWQVLLSAFRSLQGQIEAGINPEGWYIRTVVSGLRLVSAIVRSNPQHLPLFVHLHEVSKSLLMSGSQVLKPDYDLISGLVEFFSEVSKFNCESVWGDLEGCPLLPSLPAPKLVKKQPGIDLLMNYRAGNIRSLICGDEAANGSFGILKNLCSLLESALMIGFSHNNVRGTLVFIVKEVVPVMLQWRYCSVAERVSVNERIFSLLHHSLEEGCIDKELQEMVVSELSSTVGGAGATLRAVLEGGANLEAALDQPAEWPHSSHASKLTKMAQLALSLTHRLVGQYIAWSKISGKTLNEFFLGGSLHANNSVSTNISAWVSPRPSHLALTIAHFVHHRLNPRLPYLALRTLTSLAKELGVPLVACLGSEAEGVRDCLLTRLESSTEDIWVKVALLKLLATSTLYQPGLIRLFLTPPAPLLDSVVSLVQLHKEGKTEASSELLSSLIEMVASLWEGNFVTATSYLREQEDFWNGLSYCLCNKSPGAFKDDLVGNVFRIYSLEYFGAQVQICDKLDKTMKEFIDPKKDNFTTWFKHIFVASVEKETDFTDSDKGTSVNYSASNVLLSSSCEFLVVLLTRTKTTLLDEQKSFLGEKVMEGLLNLFESGNESLEDLRILLAEIHITIVHHCGKILVKSENYTTSLGRLLGCLRCSVMQTKANCQALILAGALKALASTTNSNEAAELSFLVVNAAIVLVEQHCSLVCAALGEENQDISDIKNFACSSPLTLALSCTFLHQCLLALPSSKIDALLQQSHVVYSLIQAASKHTEDGNAFVVREILRLLSLLGRQTCCPSDLSTQNLTISVSLVLSSQPKLDLNILCDLVWCTIWCLKREGASGIEGAVSLASVHLQALTQALISSDSQPDLALAAASLIVTLAPHHQLWRVIHPQCFEQMMAASACCIHYTTKMLHLKETLEREASGESLEQKSILENSSSGNLSPSTICLINQLLQVLCTCLKAVRHLSPDIVDLLCCPGLDLNPWNVTLIQPTSRKLSTEHPGTLPNLATLADILDLYHILLPKEGKQSVKECNKVINMSLLTHCAEEALVLLISYSTLFLISSDVQPREARDIRTFLADETSSFFSHWMGRKSVTSSPLPPLSPGLNQPSLPFFMLCRQIVSSLCNSQKS